MADVLLINPPWTRKRDGNIWKTVSCCMPPTGLLQIAACLEQAGFSVKLFDTPAFKIAVPDVKQYLIDNYSDSPPRFIGLTGSSVLIKYAYETAKVCKEVFPNVKIIFGGYHASSLPDEVISNEFVDFVVRDEGEFAFVEILQSKDSKDILGLTYKDNHGNIIHNKPRGYLPDLNVLPMPAYHLLSMDKYFPAVGTYKRLPAISMVVSRGCPGKCTFCYQPYGTMLRQRSPENIYKEAKYLVDNYGIKEITFYDDNFATFKSSVREFCNLVINNGLDITWSCFSRVDWADQELLNLMKKAGCHQILFGAESANQKILENIRKQIDPARIKQAVDMAKIANIDCRVTFLFGCPGETEDTMKETIQFAIDLDPDLALFNIVSPNPGTQLYQWASENGYLENKQWDEYDWSQPILNLPTVDNKTIVKYYRKAFFKFYARPSYFIKRLRKIKTMNDLKNAVAGAKGIFNVMQFN